MLSSRACCWRGRGSECKCWQLILKINSFSKLRLIKHLEGHLRAPAAWGTMLPQAALLCDASTGALMLYRSMKQAPYGSFANLTRSYITSWWNWCCLSWTWKGFNNPQQLSLNTSCQAHRHRHLRRPPKTHSLWLLNRKHTSDLTASAAGAGKGRCLSIHSPKLQCLITYTLWTRHKILFFQGSCFYRRRGRY